MASMVERMIGAAKLDATTFEEIEHDPTSIGQALGVVVIAAVASGIGGVGRAGATGLVAGLVGAVIGWSLWALVVFVVGTKLLPERQTKADFPEVLRTIGFSASPGVQTTGKAVLVCVIGWLAYVVAVFFVGSLLGISAALT